MKTELTSRIERALRYYTRKMGTFGCFEVTINFGGRERVDYMTMNTKEEFRCYEIKISKKDFESKNHNTFVGHFNYYVMPDDLARQVIKQVPKHVGILTCPTVDSEHMCLQVLRRPIRQKPTMKPSVLKNSLLRSIYREAEKSLDSEDVLRITAIQRTVDQLRKNCDTERKENGRLHTALGKMRRLLQKCDVDPNEVQKIYDEIWT